MVLDVISPKEDRSGKTRWIKCGVAFESNNGHRVLLDCYPAPNKDGDIVLLIKERQNDVSKENEPKR